jgi:hypothetical protein
MGDRRILGAGMGALRAWVSEAYPEDAAIMYADESHTGVALTEASVQLWQHHVREYTREAT